MNCTLWITVLTTLTLVNPPQERATEIERELREIEAQIERLESSDREVPEALHDAAEHLHAELEELNEYQDNVDWTLDSLRKVSPEAANELRRLQQRDPEEFYTYLEDLTEILRELEESRDENPKIYRMERSSLALNLECEALARRGREADEDARRAIREDLRERLGKLFTVRLALRKLEIERLEAELKAAREQVERMSKDRSSMIDRRIKQMLDPDADDW